ncbi:MAG: hypothetical protein SWX82_08655 [Cyanobacteriota bacterium]|nr:hypothetical protein [Cyanobacteriota bacterium]
MIKILSIILISVFSSFFVAFPARAEATAFYCNYTYTSIQHSSTCTSYHVDVVPHSVLLGCQDFPGSYEYYMYKNNQRYEWLEYCNLFLNRDSPNEYISSCFEKLFSNRDFDFIDDIKAGSLVITVESRPVDFDYDTNDFNDKIISAGCVLANDFDDSDSSCSNLSDYLFNKLSTKFPLDIFVPAYNFTASDTACPEITLFGQDMEFCAVVMVASAVKHIFIIVFIIRAVIHF